MNAVSRLVSLSALALASVLPLKASPIYTTYTSERNFEKHTAYLTGYVFPGTDPEPYHTYQLGPLTFQRGADATYYTFNDFFYGSKQSYLEYTTKYPPTPENITVTGNYTALGFEFGDGVDYTVEINGQFVRSFSTPPCHKYPCGHGFFGVTSQVPITSISFTGDSLNSDLLFFEAGSAVPEPSSIALLGTGALAAASTLRRRLALRS